jgi:hypothetical protein
VKGVTRANLPELVALLADKVMIRREKKDVMGGGAGQDALPEKSRRQVVVDLLAPEAKQTAGLLRDLEDVQKRLARMRSDQDGWKSLDLERQQLINRLFLAAGMGKRDAAAAYVLVSVSSVCF